MKVLYVNGNRLPLNLDIRYVRLNHTGVSKSIFNLPLITEKLRKNLKQLKNNNFRSNLFLNSQCCRHKLKVILF